MNPANITITDPVYVPPASRSAFDRWLLKFINDERDLPFLHVMLQATFLVFPFAALLYVPGMFRWWLGVAYLAFVALGFFDRFVLMLHNTSHRPLFKPQYKFMNHYIPWVIGPFMGESPETYFAHHLGMHHPENNLPNDLSSTMRFRRDSFLHFLQYFFRFFFLILFDLSAYMIKNKRYKLMRRMLIGELGFYAVVGVLLWVNWQATLFVFVLPFLIVRGGMMSGNWAQHAFVGRHDPANPFLNSLTCINVRYNRRAFNDGYHIGHHRKANRHWTEMPVEFEKDMPLYREADAVVFQGIDFHQTWLFLMLKRYDILAKHFVRLDGKERSDEEVIAMLKDRTRPIPTAEYEASRSSAGVGNAQLA